MAEQPKSPAKQGGNFGVVIPTMDTPPSREEVLSNGNGPAPEAPPVQSVPEGTQSDFLNAVRERNEKRGRLSDDGVHPKKPSAPTRKAASSDEEVTDQAGEGTQDAETPDDKPSLPLPRVPTEEDDTDERPARKSKDESVGDLKRNLTAERKRATQYENRVRELEEKVASYSGVDERLQEVETLRTRVADLEKYEKIFGIHNTPEFQEKKEAANTKVTTAKEIATAYGVTPELVSQALKITDIAKLTGFLAQNVKNQIGILDIRQSVTEAQKALSEIESIEKTPEQSQELLGQLVKETQDKRKSEAIKTIKARQDSAWNALLNHYANGEDAVPELREKPGDPEHTNTRNAVLNAGATEYGKVVGALANLGLTDLPAPVARSLASHYQLAPLAATLLVHKRNLEKEVQQLNKKIEDLTSYKRPKARPGETHIDREVVDPKGIKEISERVFTGAMQKVQNQQQR